MPTFSVVQVTTSFPHEVPAVPRRVLIVDDHPVFRRGIGELIELEDDLTVCSEAENSAGAISAIREMNPDGAIIDISMPGINGIELVKMIRAERRKFPILVLSMHQESIYAIRALKAGAKGYIMKSEPASRIIEGLRQVLENRTYLSPRFSDQLLFRAIQQNGGNPDPVAVLTHREKQVLKLMARNMSTREIAEHLSMSGKTVEAHRGHMRQKLFLESGAELIRFARAWEGIDDPDPQAVEQSIG